MDIDTVPEGPKHIPPYISRNESSLGELLLGFLKYYAAYFRYLPWTLHYWVSCSSAGSFSCRHSLSSAPLANFFSLSSSLSLLPLSLVSCFWLKDKNRWERLALHSTNVTYHDPCVCSVCYMPQLQDWNKTNQGNIIITFFVCLFVFLFFVTDTQTGHIMYSEHFTTSFFVFVSWIWYIQGKV